MRPLRSFLVFSLLAVLAACDSGPGASLYDPDTSPGQAPAIESVSPEGIVLAGVDEIVISGEHFSATASDNLVFFDDATGNVAQGTVLLASTTELRVKVPNLPNPALRLRVSVRGAQNFSNSVPFPLTPAFVPFGDLDAGAGVREGPAAVIGDGTGAVYVSISRGGNAGGVVRFTPDGTREAFATTRVLWNDLALGGAAGTRVFAAQSVQAIFELPGGTPVLPILTDFTVRLSAITSDGEGRIWAGGSAGTPAAPKTPSLYRFNLDGTVTATEFPGTVSDLRVFDGDLYVAATRTGATSEAKVWRLPILSDGTLGSAEVVYDVATDQPGRRPSSIAIAADGTVFVGIAPPASDSRATVEFPLIQVNLDGSSAPLYPGVLPSPISALTWGAGSELYLVRSQILPPLGQAGDPTPAALFRVETRKQGAV